ncbi:MAG: phage tail tape measure protein [Burkholderiaceae bacterium]
MAVDRSDVNFSVGADNGKFIAAFDGIKAKVSESMSGVQASFANLLGPAGALKTALAALAAVGGAAFMKDAIDATAKMTEQAMDLGRALGVSTNEARAIQMSMEDLGASTGEYEGAAKGMIKRLAENEEEMQAMGLATRDAAGNLRPLNDLVVDGIAVLGQYKEGTDRAIASKALFGKGIDASSKLMLYNTQVLQESQAAMQDLGLEVGENSVAAWKAFDAEMDRAKFGVDGIKKAIGDALMPVVTTLVEVFNGIMPKAIVVVRGALGGLAAAFLFVRTGVVVLWETINAMVVTVAEPIRALVEALYKAVTGDFSGAVTAIKSIGTNIASAWGGAMDSMVASSQKTRDQIAAIFGQDTAAGSGGGMGPGSKNAATKTQKDKKEKSAKAEKEPVEQSRMNEYQTALEQRKLVFERENQMREFSKAQELAYWQEVLAAANLGEKDRAQIVLKAAKLEVEIARSTAKQLSEVQQLRQEDRSKAELDRITELENIARQELDLGLINQKDLLAQQRDFNAQRMAVELDLLGKKLELAKLDPDKNLVLIEQLEIQKLEIMRKYAAANQQVAREMQAEAVGPIKNIIDTMSNSISRLGKTLLTDWKNIGSALKKTFSEIGFSIIEETITKPLKAKIAAWLSEKIFGKAKTLGRMGELAAEAGAGGVASMAAAPFPLNLSALGFGAAMSAAALAFAPMASAAGGFDIPAGINPIVQTHAREMILPTEQADVIRDMADGGGGAGGAMHVTIHAVDAQSIERLFRDNPQAFAAGMKQAARRGFN